MFGMRLLSHLKSDFPAGIVVFCVAVPLCLGIALASGAPLFAGLIAGIIGGLIVAPLSGSALGVSGPAAGLAVIVLEAIASLGFEAFLLAVFLSGGFQVVLGLTRAGVLSYFFPSAVIRGMLSGIGLIIILKQIPHAIGCDNALEGEVGFVQSDGETTFSELMAMLDYITWPAVAVSIIGLAILIAWEKVLRRWGGIFNLLQGPLLVVCFGLMWQLLASAYMPSLALSGEHLVSVPVVNSWTEFANLFTSPDWSSIGNRSIWITAATIAIVGSLETLLCLEATDKLDHEKRVTPANRELMAQGVGNMMAGAIGGLPITQVIVRSSANIQSGAKSKLSAIIHGGFLLLAVIALASALNMVPLAALASILLVVGYKLAKPALFVQMFRLGWSQFIPFAATVLGILFTDLLKGIAAGMAVAFVVILRRNYLNSHFLHRTEEDDEGERHRIHIRLSEEVTFLNRGAIVRELAALPDDCDVTIDLRYCFEADHDVMEVIHDFEASAASRNINVELVEAGDGQSTNRASHLIAS
jgi:MFS superfamily sulfate permease-like transporter